MNLKDVKWELFYLKDLFEIQMGNGFDLNKMNSEIQEVNFVSRTSSNNGISSKVEKLEGVEPFSAGLLTVALGGEYLGSCFVQLKPFYTGQNVAVLKPKYNQMTLLVNIFISQLIRFESEKRYFAFGRELNSHLKNDFAIKLPTKDNKTDDGKIEPNWSLIENEMKKLHYKPIKKEASPISLSNYDCWQQFKVGDLFPKRKAKHYSKIPEMQGDIPFVSSTSLNNGISAKVNADYIEGNCITVSTNGDCFDCFYQPDKFCISSDAEALYNDNLNKYNALFICSVLMLEKKKYCFGIKPKNGKVYNTIIKLPAKHILSNDGTIIYEKDDNNNFIPDWKYMEKYIQSLQYGNKI